MAGRASAVRLWGFCVTPEEGNPGMAAQAAGGGEEAPGEASGMAR